MLQKLKDLNVELLTMRGARHIRNDDFIIASFPKTGSTFTRFVFANMISILNMDGETVDFNNLNDIMPDLIDNDLHEAWPYKHVPRILKTHSAYRSSFGKARGHIYVVRDPRDTMISYYQYQKKRKSVSYDKTISDFIRNPYFGIRVFNRHLESWLKEEPFIFRYEELMGDAEQGFVDFTEKFGLDIPKEVISRSIELSRPERVRKLEEERGRPDLGTKFPKDHVFVRSAKVGQWKNVLSPEDLDYIRVHSSPLFSQLGYQL